MRGQKKIIATSVSLIVLGSSFLGIGNPKVSADVTFENEPSSQAISLNEDSSLTNANSLTQIPDKPNYVPFGEIQAHTTSVELSWKPVINATSYVLTRDGIIIYQGTDLSFKDIGLIPNTRYTYEISALNGNISSDTNGTAVTTLVEEPLLSPTDFRVYPQSPSEIMMHWDPVNDATYYELKRDGAVIYTGPQNSFEDIGLSPEKEYTYTLIAKDAKRTSEEKLVKVFTISPDNLPFPTEIPTNVKAEWDGSKVVISWIQPDTSIGIQVERTGGLVVETKSSPYYDSNVAKGSTVSYKVRALNGTIYSDPVEVYVNIPSSSTDPLPETISAPSELKLLGRTPTSLKLGWTAVRGATSYELKNGDKIVYTGTDMEYNDTGLVPGRMYQYSVVAIKNGVKSIERRLNELTYTEVVSAPVGLKPIDITYNTVTMAWDEVSDVENYTILRNGEEVTTVTSTTYKDNSVSEGLTYVYGVIANKSGIKSKKAIKSVSVPLHANPGEAPSTPTNISVTSVSNDTVEIKWDRLSTATSYKVIRDGKTLVYQGQITEAIDHTVVPNRMYQYEIIGINSEGETSSGPLLVHTSGLPLSINVSPADLEPATVTFKFRLVDSSANYVVDSPFKTTFVPINDGTNRFLVLRYDTETDRNQPIDSIVPDKNGYLSYKEFGIAPGKTYNYTVSALSINAYGMPEVIARNSVSILAPADGSGATINVNTTPNPGPVTTDPGNESKDTNPEPSTSPQNGHGGYDGDLSEKALTDSGETGSNKNSTEEDDKVPSITTVQFTDVPTTHFGYEAIMALAKKGVVKGYSDNSFGINKKVTRAEFTVMLTRAMNYNPNEKYNLNFLDVEANAWYASDLNAAFNKGIIQGYNKNSFKPDEFITREQAAVVFSNTAKEKLISFKPSVTLYADNDLISSWARKDVDNISGIGVMRGYDDGSFGPKGEITRAEAATAIYKLTQMLQ
ncbi:S-layer homology domain-containing protein [Paenibacillus cellulositrophicus]|uniref:S-layer homology domain-containing protein n=1 Tax=Paenibacillus cellulositrophicus TaxID=562959 RepID=UPI001267457B|nr:S-layer homology domain-containing protein [Paenibacillus cellulositrophicus]